MKRSSKDWIAEKVKEDYPTEEETAAFEKEWVSPDKNHEVLLAPGEEPPKEESSWFFDGNSIVQGLAIFVCIMLLTFATYKFSTAYGAEQACHNSNMTLAMTLEGEFKCDYWVKEVPFYQQNKLKEENNSLRLDT